MSREQILALTQESFPTLSFSAQARIADFTKSIADEIRVPAKKDWIAYVVKESYGMRLKAFCAKYGVKKTTLYRWRKSVEEGTL